MKKHFLLLCLLLGVSWLGRAQVTISPTFPTVTQSVTLTFDATQGNAALVGATTVYMHAGVVTTKPNDTQWSYVKGNWGQDDGLGRMTSIGNNKWQFTFVPQTYFAVPATENVFRLAMVFRNADGSKRGAATGDAEIFVNINPGYYSLITAPTSMPHFRKVNESAVITATASSASTMSIAIDNVTVKSATNATTITHSVSYTTAGQHTVRVTSSNGIETEQKTFTLYIANNSPIQARPAGVKDGINYINNTTVTLSLYAPNKDYVYVTGDFNSWTIDPAYQMKKTPDGKRFWITLTGLQFQREYIFQYYVDGKIRIADPYTDKVADPWNDKNISTTTYPGLIAYTNEQYGIASTFQTGQVPYQWQVKNFQGVPKHKLIVYELLIRDFTAAHSYQAVIDSIQYLKKLGINAIELMPVNEFEGNESWGYNPSFYFAPDKYYGPKNKLKALIDAAHANGMAVIIDMVLNHSFGQSPMVRLYWDEANNRPSADSPWFNTTQKNTDYAWGSDFNHESADTKRFVDSVNNYWLNEYKVDGLRYDFTKGFTQTVGNGWAYDQSRINILTRMADQIWAVNPNAYVILEHLTDDSEESALAGYRNGMLPWKHVKDDYKEVISGWQHGTRSFAGAQNDYRMIYMESHDEERIMVQNLSYGNAEGSYDIKALPTALDRLEMGAAFLYTVPGPKMLWMFGEQGYSYSINYCPNGTISSDCRVSNKPLVWSQYMSDPDRRDTKSIFAALLNLRKDHPVFTDGVFTWGSAIGETRWLKITHSSMNVMVLGNFGTHANPISPSFPPSANWYNYFTGSEFNASGSITLAAGEWLLLTDKKLPLPAGFKPSTMVTTNPANFSDTNQITITFDAKKAPGGSLVGASKVYMHSGVVLGSRTGTTWTNVVGTWGADNGVGQMTPVAGQPDKWQITLTPRTYYTGVPTSSTIYRLAMVFRDASGAKTARGPGSKDIFIDVPPVAVPTTLAAVVQPKQINLTWADNMQTETSYVVERSTSSSSGFMSIATLPANSTSYADTWSGLQNATYYYRVKAVVNSTLSSGYSNTVSAAFVYSFTVYFYRPATWTAANVHYWNYVPSTAMSPSTFPGPAMAAAPGQGAGWYQFTFTGVNSTSLLFDNNGSSAQTPNLTRNKTGWYKDGAWHDSKPAGTGLTIHFKKPAAWATVKMHYWNIQPATAAANTVWPGVTMTNNGNGWWSYTIPNASCANFVFSNNGASQTPDLTHCGESWYDNGWLAQNPGGRLTTAPIPGVDEEEVALEQNYPNPFSDVTNVPFSIPRAQHVNINVFDTQGRLVMIVLDERVEAGHHSAVVDGNMLQSGVFYYQLRTIDVVKQKRFMVKK